MESRSFELWVPDRGSRGSYEVYARTPQLGKAKAELSLDPAAPPFAELSALLSSPRTAQELRELGAALFDRLFAGPVRSLFLLALGEVFADDRISLRLLLEIDPPELAVLPWEMLFSAERQTFLATSPRTTISRTLPLIEPVRPIAHPGDLRALLLLPQSSGLPTGAEEEALARFVQARGGRAEIRRVSGKVTQEAIRKTLRENEIHLVHYGGHGIFWDGEAAVFLDRDNGLPERMPASTFASLFLDIPSVRLVVLNACQGASGSSIHALAGVAPELLRRGIPAVIAMQSLVLNSEAVRFSATFYAELAQGCDPGSIETALARARSALLQDHPESPGFASPVLYLRGPEGQLWKEEGPHPRELAEAVRRNALRVRQGLEPFILPRISRLEVRDKYLPAVRERRGRILPILGSAGFGKSTLLGELHDLLQAEGLPWLALVDSGELALSQPADLSLAVGRAASGREIGVAELAATLHRASGPGVLLLDTLDLVLGPALVAHLQRLLSDLGESATTVVFTCRDHDYQLLLEPPGRRMPQVADRIDRYRVPAFSEGEVEEAARAFVAAEPRLAASPAGQDFADRILHLSADSRPLREIVSNPLLLALLCELFAQAGDVPQDLTVSELYDRYWDEKVARSRVFDPGSPALLEKPRLCLRLAQVLLERSADRLRESAVEADLDLPISAPLAGAREDLLSEGVLKHQADRLRFFHQTFLEYAMARWLATHAGSPARERLLATLRAAGDGSAHLYWWPVLRQLLLRLEEEELAAVESRLPREGLAGFRTLGLVAAARGDSRLLAKLLERALALGSEHQKTLCRIVEAAPPRLADGAWNVIRAVLLAGEREAALFAAQTAGVLLKRRGGEIGTRLGELLDCVDRRRAALGDGTESLDLLGQLLRACLKALEANPDPAALALVRERYFACGARIRSALVTLFSAPQIPAASREEFLGVLLAQPPGKGLVPELLELLLQALRSRHPQLPEDRSVLWQATVPPAWEGIQARAAARLLAEDDAWISATLADLRTVAPERLQRDVHVLHEMIQIGQSPRLGRLLLALDVDALPEARARVCANLVARMAETLDDDLRSALAIWLEARAERRPEEVLDGFAAVAGAAERTWRTLTRIFRDSLAQGRSDLAGKIVASILPEARSRLLTELEGVVGQQPQDSTHQLLSVPLLTAQAPGSPAALESLCRLAAGPNKSVALAASSSLAALAGLQERPSAEDLLPLAESPYPGVRDHLLLALSKLREAGRELTGGELRRLCHGLREESNLSTLQALCTFVGLWVRQAGRVPPEVAEGLARILGRLGGRLEAGVARALIRTLKILAQLEDRGLLPWLAEPARDLLLQIDLNRLNDGESEMTDLLSAVSRLEPGFLTQLLDLGPRLYARNLQALAWALKRVEGAGSPHLSTILEAEWCPPAVRLTILELRGV